MIIQKTDGVCGGSARIGNTRIPVWTIIAFRLRGAEDKQLLEYYPNLTEADLDATWNYYQENQAEIDNDIQENES